MMMMHFIDFFFPPRAELNVIHGFSEMVLKGHFVNLWNWHWVDSGGGSWSSSICSRPTASTWAIPAHHHACHWHQAIAHACHRHLARDLICPEASTPGATAHWTVRPPPALLWSSHSPAPPWWYLLPCSGISSLSVGLALPPINALCEQSPPWLSLWFCLWAMVEWNGQIKYFNIFSLSRMNQNKGTI